MNLPWYLLAMTWVTRAYPQIVRLVLLLGGILELVLHHVNEAVQVLAALLDGLAFELEHLAGITVGGLDLLDVR